MSLFTLHALWPFLWIGRCFIGPNAAGVSPTGQRPSPKSRARWTISSGVCLLVTVNVPLDWAAMIGTLRPKGRMHVVGAVLEPIPVNSMDVIMTQGSVSGSPNGSPVTMQIMLEFAARHGISPQTEHFPMQR